MGCEKKYKLTIMTFMYVDFTYFDETTVEPIFPKDLLTEYVLTKVMLENVSGNLVEASAIVNDLVMEQITLKQQDNYRNLYSSPTLVVPFSFTVSPMGGFPLTTTITPRISLRFDEPQPSDKLRIIIEWKIVKHHTMLVNNLNWSKALNSGKQFDPPKNPNPHDSYVYNGVTYTFSQDFMDHRDGYDKYDYPWKWLQTTS